MTGPEQSLDLDALEAVVRAWRSAPKVSEDKVERLRLLTEYRETFDPPTVLALIERVRRAEGQPSESYPLGWLEAVVHWNPESGAIHTDGNREALRALIAKAEEAP